MVQFGDESGDRELVTSDPAGTATNVALLQGLSGEARSRGRRPELSKPPGSDRGSAPFRLQLNVKEKTGPSTLLSSAEAVRHF